MKLLVCLGNVPDTTTKVKFSGDNSEFDTTGIQWVINPWDELALTRALELKEDPSNPVSHVSVATVGLIGAEPTMRKALAIGADDAIRVDLDAKDSAIVAAELAEFIKTGKFDIVLCELESKISDCNSCIKFKLDICLKDVIICDGHANNQLPETSNCHNQYPSLPKCPSSTIGKKFATLASQNFN